MDDFERLLQQSLEREEAPEGFERRVLAAVNRPRFGWTRWIAIAAMLAVIGGAGVEFENARRERAAGEDAKAKLELALRVTSAKLHKVQQALDSAGEGF